MRISWLKDPACQDCPLIELGARSKWGNSGMGRAHQAAARVEFQYLRINTWEGQYTGIIPKSVTMSDLIG